jgi:hypothetical protein
LSPVAGKQTALATNAVPANARLPQTIERPTVPRAASPSDWFSDVTLDSGVSFAYRNASEAGFYQLLESVGGGVSAFDYDGDGDQDLFFTGGGKLSGLPIAVTGRPCALYRNEGNWQFTDVTHASGLAHTGQLFSHGCTVADVNSDGFPDLFVAGFRGVRLYLNLGDATFEEVSESAGLNCPNWNVTGAAADYDRDGLIDLYVVTYADWTPDAERRCLNDQGLHDICGPTLFEGVRDQLWRNLGDGRFEDVSERVGLVPANRGLGIVACDINVDGWNDFLVVNDVQANQLYLGTENGSFREQGLQSGVSYSSTGEREGSMGVDIGDFDGDDRLDIWYTNYAQQDNSLLRHVSESGYIHAGTIAGLAGLSRPWVGFGTGFADFDCDGWQDLYVVNGHVAYDRRDSPYFQPAQLFRNNSGTSFDDVTESAGPYFSIPRSARGSVTADLDNDGDDDLVVVHQNDPVALLKNRQTPLHWVALELVGTTSDRDAIGAWVSIITKGRTVTRVKRGGGSYLSHCDPRIRLALESENPVDVHVHWPSGQVEKFDELRAGVTHVLVEGRGRSG